MSKTVKSNNSNESVSAFPSKWFFVEMLTRDIELKDAILDLLDNCLDGAVRTIEAKTKEHHELGNDDEPYKGFKASIEYGKKFFRISDNCGGMDRKTLVDHAFRLGRPSFERDKDISTVGLYGIGMKRAIFKLGRSCTVTTRNEDEAYRITITPDWLADDKNWELPLEEVPIKGLQKGTVIEVTNLRDEVASVFDTSKSKAFDESFKTLVSTHYSYIIHKKFEVDINSDKVRPKEIHLRFDEESLGKNKLAPYMFRGVFGTVSVDLVVGLYRPVPSVSEIEEINMGLGNRKDNAGWTVICNDRVVLYNDTTHLTGWGEGTVPKYHPQFIAVAGVVRFSSTHPSDLPLTTTKRGINQNSVLYSGIKNVMRDGTKHFTDFTNKWKSDSSERRDIYKRTIGVEPLEALNLVKPKEWMQNKRLGGLTFVPKLPSPPSSPDSKKIIKFSRPEEDIQLVAEYLFGESDTPPSKVGEKCFDDYYRFANSDR